MKALLLLFAMTATAVAADRPVDWTKLLPPSLTGTVALEEQDDGTKIVTLASKRLFALYLEGYGAGKTSSQDLAECREAVASQGTDGSPGMMVWLDATLGGLAVLVGLPHLVAACEEPVVIPASVLRAEGAQPALLRGVRAVILLFAGTAS